tara:strand:- start:658 stop:834 length:177 start_codon:yes stop_codon:yes gene_type:complete
MEKDNDKTIMELLRARLSTIERLRDAVRTSWKGLILFIEKHPLWALFAFVGIISLLFW